MSNLTDIIITCGPTDDVTLVWLQRVLETNGVPLRKLREPFLMLAGTKNYLQLDALETIIQEALWYNPYSVQLFIRGEHVDTFAERKLSCKTKIEYFSVQNDTGEWKTRRAAVLIGEGIEQ